jgi:hypothetical protein
MNEEKRFGEIFIMSCSTHSWYKDKIGTTIIACLIGTEDANGIFILKYPYDYEAKGERIVLKKPYSLIDIIML